MKEKGSGGDRMREITIARKREQKGTSKKEQVRERTNKEIREE
jgi:hypothetical protein